MLALEHWAFSRRGWSFLVVHRTSELSLLHSESLVLRTNNLMKYSCFQMSRASHFSGRGQPCDKRQHERQKMAFFSTCVAKKLPNNNYFKSTNQLAQAQCLRNVQVCRYCQLNLCMMCKLTLHEHLWFILQCLYISLLKISWNLHQNLKSEVSKFWVSVWIYIP